MDRRDHARDHAWQTIFNRFMADHDFEAAPYILDEKKIKAATSYARTTGGREVRLLMYVTSRAGLPECLRNRNVFPLPIRNGVYALIRGEGFLDIEPLTPDVTAIDHQSRLGFDLISSRIGDSEMQHLDYSYAVSMLRTFVSDETLQMTIRGRKYTPNFNFRVGKFHLEVQGVQTEVDGGYEGMTTVVLVEVKSRDPKDIIIRQLFYPYRQWKYHTRKRIIPVLLTKRNEEYIFRQFEFNDDDDYNSVQLVQAKIYRVARP